MYVTYQQILHNNSINYLQHLLFNASWNVSSHLIAMSMRDEFMRTYSGGRHQL